MKGCYVLQINLKKDLKIKIGSLGCINFKKGIYFYIGSALGNKINIEKRLERHFSKNKKIKWHIDYLLANENAEIKNVFVFPSRRKIECKVSKNIEKLAKRTIEKFGSSDCECKGHLHYFEIKANPNLPFAKVFET